MQWPRRPGGGAGARPPRPGQGAERAAPSGRVSAPRSGRARGAARRARRRRSAVSARPASPRCAPTRARPGCGRRGAPRRPGEVTAAPESDPGGAGVRGRRMLRPPAARVWEAVGGRARPRRGRARSPRTRVPAGWEAGTRAEAAEARPRGTRAGTPAGLVWTRAWLESPPPDGGSVTAWAGSGPPPGEGTGGLSRPRSRGPQPPTQASFVCGLGPLGQDRTRPLQWGRDRGSLNGEPAASARP